MERTLFTLEQQNTVATDDIKLEWKADNELSLAKLQEAIRGGNKKCVCRRLPDGEWCPNIAGATHHIDHDHDNNEPSNLAPACIVHHMLEHGNTVDMCVLKLMVRTLDGIQKQKVAMGNRVKAYENLSDLFDDECVEWIGFARNQHKELEAVDGRFDRQLKAVLMRFPIWYEWMEKVHGIGPRLAARLISEIRIETTNSVRSMWHYAGEHVVNGKAAKKQKKDEDGNWQGGWNHKLKRASWMVGAQFVRSKSLGRELYDKYRAEYEAREEKRAHFLAMRRARKDFLRCLWVRWRELEELPVTEPQKGTWPMADDWVV